MCQCFGSRRGTSLPNPNIDAMNFWMWLYTVIHNAFTNQTWSTQLRDYDLVQHPSSLGPEFYSRIVYQAHFTLRINDM